MTLADALPAKKTIKLRSCAAYAHSTARSLQFVGSLMVPKHLDDGRYPVVDVWTHTMTEVIITPWTADPKRPHKLFIGAADLNHLDTTKYRLLHIDTVRGVEPSGYGFGFALYAAAALAVKFAGPDGIYSMPSTRSIDASELWTRMKKLSFSWMGGPFVRELPRKYETYDFLLGQSVLDSGLVVRLGQKYGRQWASFRPPPTKNFAYDLKFTAKKLSPSEKYFAAHGATIREFTTVYSQPA